MQSTFPSPSALSSVPSNTNHVIYFDHNTLVGAINELMAAMSRGG